MPGTPHHPHPTRGRFTSRLATISPWVWVLAVLAIALAFQVPATATVLFVLVTVVGAVATAGSKRIQEWFERKPDLSLGAVCDGEIITSIESGIPQPWPFELEAVVANEVARVREDADNRDRLARSPGPFALYHASALAIRPSAETHDRARETFDEKIETYAGELHQWLTDYRAAADARTRTFELCLGVTSARRGAYAEDASLVIQLPEGVEVVEDWPTLAPPPEPPVHIPPRPRDPSEIARPSYGDLGVRPRARIAPSIAVPDVSLWRTHPDGRRVERALGNIHHDATVEFDEPLPLRVPGPGRHTLAWTLRTKNGRRHRSGRLELIVPGNVERPPFKRLKGILEFPDVPLVADGDGVEQVTTARTVDPPTTPPPPETRSLEARLQSSRARDDWFELGLADGDEDVERELFDVTDWSEMFDSGAVDEPAT